jgi:hypothetical protein
LVDKIKQAMNFKYALVSLLAAIVLTSGFEVSFEPTVRDE